MDIFTQLVFDKLKYNQILSKELKPNVADSVYPDVVVTRIFMIIGLVSGLPLKYIIKLKWSNIISINSKSQPIINESIGITRYYNFPLNPKLHKQLSNSYINLKQPSLDSFIIDSYTKPMSLDDILLGMRVSLTNLGDKEMRQMRIANYKDEAILQRIFGRRVFEVCGYTNQTAKKLKNLFKLKYNNELFEFLGYSSKADINYRLGNISLVEGIQYKYKFGEPKSFMDDNKHFLIKMEETKKFYPFQHFQVFYDFLIKSQPYKHSLITHSIVILLLISLTNGIRLSSLLRLKWSDILIVDQENASMSFKKEVTFKNHILCLNDDVLKKINMYFISAMKVLGVTIDRIANPKESTYKIIPNINLPFILTNKGTGLTQPSLHRELIKALHELEFIHANKFTTKSTLIMYGRRIIELKGSHKPAIQLLKEHFNFKSTTKLFGFLYISEYKGDKGKEIKEFDSVFEHILYDI